MGSNCYCQQLLLRILHLFQGILPWKVFIISTKALEFCAANFLYLAWQVSYILHIIMKEFDGDLKTPNLQTIQHFHAIV